MASFKYTSSVSSGPGPDATNTEAVAILAIPDGFGGTLRYAVTASKGQAAAENGLAIYAINETGGSATLGTQTDTLNDTAPGAEVGDIVDISSVTIGNTAFVFGLSRADNAIQALSVDNTGQITQLSAADLSALTGNANFSPTGLDLVEQNGQIYLMATGSDGLHAIEFTPGTGNFTGTPTDSEVLGSTAANGYWGYTSTDPDPNSFVDVEVVGGTRFVLTGGGNNGSGLDLFTFDASGGGLTHVSSVQSSNFTEFRAADMVSFNGQTYIVAGGDEAAAGQDGLTLFSVSSSGPLFTLTQVSQTPLLFDTINAIEIVPNASGNGYSVLIGQENGDGMATMWLGIDGSTGAVTLTRGVDDVTDAEASGSMANVSSIAVLDGIVLTGSDSSSQAALMSSSTYIPQSGNYCFLGETALGGAGLSFGGAGDFDGDGFGDILIGAGGDTNFLSDPSVTGEAYLISASDLQLLDQADLTEDGQIDLSQVIGSGNSYKFSTGTGGDTTGRALQFVDDIDGDGRDDILIGAPGSDTPFGNMGNTFLLTAQDLQAADASDGSLDGEIELDQVNFSSLTSSYRFIWQNAPALANANVGFDVDSIGDLDGDGRSELLISGWGIGLRPTGSGANNRSGTAFVISSQDYADADLADGSADNTIDLANFATLPTSRSFEFIGSDGIDSLGRSLSMIGDVDGDGLNDFLLGARGLDGSGSNEGGAFIVSSRDLQAADALDVLGSDGRIFADNLVNSITTNDSYQFIGESSNDQAGLIVSGMIDATGDGRGDALIGSSLVSGGPFNSGAVYMISGAELENADLADAINDQSIDLGNISSLTDSYKITGSIFEQIAHIYGDSLGYTQDTDGDGLNDLLIGGRGVAYLLSSADLDDADLADGSLDGEIQTSNVHLQSNSYQFNLTGGRFATVSDAGDVDNDGISDFYIGTPGAPIGINTRAGAVFLVRGAQLEQLDNADGTDDNIIDFTDHVGFVCFARGTKIETENGPVAVEDLCENDLVLTHDNGLQPVCWIGSRKVPGHGKLAPICIKHGTFGATEDLFVSPQHRILIEGCIAELFFGEDEVLATAKSLLNSDQVFSAPCEEIEYFHILFDTHQVIYANGAPCESYHPGEEGMGTMSDEAREEIISLFPELETSVASYGPSARRSLKQFEGRTIAEALF